MAEITSPPPEMIGIRTQMAALHTTSDRLSDFFLPNFDTVLGLEAPARNQKQQFE
jgi:hypothetical protein